LLRFCTHFSSSPIQFNSPPAYPVTAGLRLSPPAVAEGMAWQAETTENTPRIFSHRPTQTNADREDRLQLYGEPYDKK
jgi:hypothetical protein